MPSTDELRWLEQWYAARCDGEWEHAYGVTIETLDNPGWIVRVDLVGTPLEPRSTPDQIVYQEGVTDADDPNTPSSWIVCRVRERQFQGAGDPSRLREILRRFRAWIDRASPS